MEIIVVSNRYLHYDCSFMLITRKRQGRSMLIVSRVCVWTCEHFLSFHQEIGGTWRAQFFLFNYLSSDCDSIHKENLKFHSYYDIITIKKYSRRFFFSIQIFKTLIWFHMILCVHEFMTLINYLFYFT